MTPRIIPNDDGFQVFFGEEAVCHVEAARTEGDWVPPIPKVKDDRGHMVYERKSWPKEKWQLKFTARPLTVAELTAVLEAVQARTEG